jgi:hypothetical protein
LPAERTPRVAHQVRCARVRKRGAVHFKQHDGHRARGIAAAVAGLRPLTVGAVLGRDAEAHDVGGPGLARVPGPQSTISGRCARSAEACTGADCRAGWNHQLASFRDCVADTSATTPATLRFDFSAPETPDSLRLTCGRHESTQTFVEKWLMDLDKPCLELAMNNPG